MTNLETYDIKRRLFGPGDIVSFAADHSRYFQVAMLVKTGRRWQVEGGMVADGEAWDTTIASADLTRHIKSGNATVIKAQ